MAKGFGFVDKTGAERKARQGGASVFAGKLLFKLADGESQIVRFIPDEDGDFIYGARHHDVPVEGRAWGDNVVCIAQDDEGNITDDPCPGCENDLKMKERFYVHVLWREGPIYKKDDKGKLVKDNTGDLVVLDHEDQTAVWPMGPQLAESLAEIDESYDLGSRDFRIKRKGSGLDTEYTILPADVDGGKEPLSKADKKLVADSEIDLTEFIKPPSYEDFENRLNGKRSGGGSASSDSSNGKPSAASRSAAKKNPFNRSRK